MQCQVCDKTFATKLSVCPSCGSMTTQHNQTESKLRFHSIEKITTNDLVLEIGETIDVQAVHASLENDEEKPAAKRFAAQSNDFSANNFSASSNADAARKTRTLNSTLLEFPGKKPMKNAPEWRDEIKNRVKMRKTGGSADSGQTSGGANNGGAAESAELALAQNEPALVINLKPKIHENKQAAASSVAARALERVERSRRQFQNNYQDAEPLRESAFQPPVQPEPAPLSLVPNTGIAQAHKRKMLPMIEDDSAAAIEKTIERDAMIEVEDHKSERAATFKNGQPIASKIQAAPNKRTIEDLTRETNSEKYDDLEDDESVAAAQSSVRKKVSLAAALGNQQAHERTSAVAAERNRSKQTAEDFAPLGSRFLAGAIDFCVCAAVAAGLIYALGLWQSMIAGEHASLWQPLVLIGALEFVYLTALLVLSGTTVGGKIFSLSTVAAEDGYIPTLAQAAINSAAYLLVLLTGGIGLITVFFSTERRALHDLIAGTVVVSNEG